MTLKSSTVHSCATKIKKLLLKQKALNTSLQLLSAKQRKLPPEFQRLTPSWPWKCQYLVILYMCKVLLHWSVTILYIFAGLKVIFMYRNITLVFKIILL